MSNIEVEDPAVVGFGGGVDENLGRRINRGKAAGWDLADEICHDGNDLTHDIASL